MANVPLAKSIFSLVVWAVILIKALPQQIIGLIYILLIQNLFVFKTYKDNSAN